MHSPGTPIPLASSCFLPWLLACHSSQKHSRLGKSVRVCVKAVAYRVTLCLLYHHHCAIYMPVLHITSHLLQLGMLCLFWIEWMILTSPCCDQKLIIYSAPSYTVSRTFAQELLFLTMLLKSYVNTDHCSGILAVWGLDLRTESVISFGTGLALYVIRKSSPCRQYFYFINFYKTGSHTPRVA